MEECAHQEVCCQICGVSFNIGRYPTRSEAKAGLPDARWLRNTQAMRAQVVGSCGDDCRMGILVEKPGDSSPPQLAVKSLKPISKIKRRRYNSDEQHIAGSACSKLGGYSGASISAKEIRGCCTFQCLVPKQNPRRFAVPGVIPLGNKPKVERNFYLSGLSDLMPSKGYVQSTWPPDWEYSSLSVAKNTFSNAEEATKAAMPFHSSCLEVFRRVSVHRWGVIDFDVVMDWYRLEAQDEKYYRDFPRHPLVTKAKTYWQTGTDQLWLHHAGSEFLAANPCFVPALPSIISSAVNHQISRSDYLHISQVAPGQHQSSDPMSRLPLEIRLFLASFLDARDFGSLRSASRAFHDLPQSFFQHLISREYPWLWETWCTIPYTHQVANESWELRATDTAWQEEQRQLDREKRILQAEMTSSGDPQHYLPKINSLKERIAEREVEMTITRMLIPQQKMPLVTNEVDWFGLYCTLSHNFDNLKGLRNRRRIWKDCEEIHRRIEKHRAEGRIKTRAIED